MAALTPARWAALLGWRVRRAWRHPLAGPLGLLAAVAVLAVALQWQQQTARARQAQQTALAAQPPPAALPRAAAAQRRQALTDFYAALPPQDDLPEQLQALIDLADRQGLRLQRGNYRLESEPAAGFARYRMALPLRGEPARVQQFVQAALLAHATLAIDSLQFKREADGPGALEARVQWVLYLRADPRADPPADAPADARADARADGPADLTAGRPPAPPARPAARP